MIIGITHTIHVDRFSNSWVLPKRIALKQNKQKKTTCSTALATNWFRIWCGSHPSQKPTIAGWLTFRFGRAACVCMLGLYVGNLGVAMGC